ncbi:MAG: formyltransferase [Exilibacterium sp.]
MNIPSNRTVLFAYSNVGVRGLAALLANRFDVRLVVTHEDNPQENIWYDSVAELAALNEIPVIKPDDANTQAVVEQIRALEPDWLFSFYYRHLLCEQILNIPARGAFNLHGSLLPRFRGRAPTNWAVLKGEIETGASLHRMVLKPDAGALVDQQAVPILPNDTAEQVFQKVTCAAEMVLMRSLPRLCEDTATEIPMDLQQGSYFGARRPEHGRIDWRQPAQTIHNQIRAVAPPYPGAFFEIEAKRGKRFVITGSYFRDLPAQGTGPRLYWQTGKLWADCRDGKRLQLLGLIADGNVMDENTFKRLFGPELQMEFDD